MIGNVFGCDSSTIVFFLKEVFLRDTQRNISGWNDMMSEICLKLWGQRRNRIAPEFIIVAVGE